MSKRVFLGWLMAMLAAVLIISGGFYFGINSLKLKQRAIVSNGKLITDTMPVSYGDLTSSNSRQAFLNYTRLARVDPHVKKKYPGKKIPKPLVIIVHKVGCSHCKIAEPIIMSAVAKELPKGSNLLTVDVTVKVPSWLKSVNGIMDSNGELHTPTILVTQLVPGRNSWEWVTIDRYTGTNKAQINHALDLKLLEKSSAVDIQYARKYNVIGPSTSFE